MPLPDLVAQNLKLPNCITAFIALHFTTGIIESNLVNDKPAPAITMRPLVLLSLTGLLSHLGFALPLRTDRHTHLAARTTDKYYYPDFTLTPAEQEASKWQLELTASWELLQDEKHQVSTWLTYIQDHGAPPSVSSLDIQSVRIYKTAIDDAFRFISTHNRAPDSLSKIQAMIYSHDFKGNSALKSVFEKNFPRKDGLSRAKLPGIADVNFALQGALPGYGTRRDRFGLVPQDQVALHEAYMQNPEAYNSEMQGIDNLRQESNELFWQLLETSDSARKSAIDLMGGPLGDGGELPVPLDKEIVAQVADDVERFAYGAVESDLGRLIAHF